MRRFEQIIEDQYKRLGIALEAEDEGDPLEDDNEKQKKDLEAHKQYTDKAEDEAHDSDMNVQSARQKLATTKTQYNQNQATRSDDKRKDLEAKQAS
jgi:hypothetical protein